MDRYRNEVACSDYLNEPLGEGKTLEPHDHQDGGRLYYPQF
jgi:hypothetical protein